MEELTKKTTILFSLEQYDYLRRLAKRRQTSVGDLVRTACKEQYGGSSVEDRIKSGKGPGPHVLAG